MQMSRCGKQPCLPFSRRSSRLAVICKLQGARNSRPLHRRNRDRDILNFVGCCSVHASRKPEGPLKISKRTVTKKSRPLCSTPCARYLNSSFHFQGQPGRSSIARLPRALFCPMVPACSLPSFKGWPGLVHNCARRTTTAHRGGSVSTGDQPGYPSTLLSRY